MPRFSLKIKFSHLSPEKPHKCVLKPSEQCLFSKTLDLRGHMPSFSLKIKFSHLSPEKPHKCALKP